MYILYELATGRNHSQSSTAIINPNTSVWGVKQTELTGIWNESTLDFDPIPVSKIVSVDDFILWFTQPEKEALISAAETNVKAKTFVKILPLLRNIDLESEFIVTAINGMEALGILSSARAAEVLLNV